MLDEVRDAPYSLFLEGLFPDLGCDVCATEAGQSDVLFDEGVPCCAAAFQVRWVDGGLLDLLRFGRCFYWDVANKGKAVHDVV